MLGSRGAFTAAALETLLDAGAPVAGLALPRALPDGPPARPLPRRRTLRVGAASAEESALAAGIPVWEVGPLAEPGADAVLDALRPDALACACFPRLVPARWCERAGWGAVNLHPSLLPRWRGPTPLFWQLREGAAVGVTLHRMTGRFDAGPILAREERALPDGIGSDEADRLLAAAAARLLARALAAGALPPGLPQDEGAATCQGFPGPAERRIPRSWSARRAFNFARGAARWGPFAVEDGDGPVEIVEALGWLADGEAAAPAQPGEAHLAFADGVLRARLAEARPRAGPLRRGG